MTNARTIVQRVDKMRSFCSRRDAAMREAKLVREGRWDEVCPGLFPDEFPRPVVANFIDVAAKDISSVIAALPTYECRSGSMVSNRARQFADKRTRIAKGYIEESNLQNQFLTGVDRWLTYGFMAVGVEPDPVKRVPRIYVHDQFGSYYQLDRLGRRTVWYANVFRRPVFELAAQYPEAAEALMAIFPDQYSTKEVELIRWQDGAESLLVTVEGNVVLSRAPNPLGRCMVHIVELPHVGPVTRGQFDDVVWVQIAKAKMALYQLQSADTSVNAPLVVPDDVTDLNIGPGSIIQTNNPGGVGRVNLQIPQGVFAEGQILEQELRTGTRYPEGRSGNIDASIITGQGVEALMGNFTAQTKTGQLQLAQLQQDVLMDCFELDQKLWPSTSKTVLGVDNGSRYEITYTPIRDINGNFTCDVTYGLTAGLDPNRALVFLLQGKTAGLFSADTTMRQLPLDIDVEMEKQKIDIESTEQALGQAIGMLAQAIPMMATQGQDPAAIVSAIAKVIDLRGKGQSLTEAVQAAFPPPPPPTQAPPGDEAEPGAGGEQPPPPGGPPTGGQQGIQAPDPGSQLLMTLAGTTRTGNPNLQANISGQYPV